MNNIHGIIDDVVPSATGYEITVNAGDFFYVDITHREMEENNFVTGEKVIVSFPPEALRDSWRAGRRKKNIKDMMITFEEAYKIVTGTVFRTGKEQVSFSDAAGQGAGGAGEERHGHASVE